MPLEQVPPTDTRRLFRPIASELTALLRTLPSEAWNHPTVAGTWRVHDVVAHLVDVSMRRISWHRDRHTPPAPWRPPQTDREFVAFINGLNGQWVDAARRISPRMLTDVHEFVAAALADFTESFPDNAPALFPVSWAGEAQSDGWFDLGREFTEHWHHQAQVPRRGRRATAAGSGVAPRCAADRLARPAAAFRDTLVGTGRMLVVEITGASGGVWTLRRDDSGWTLWAGQETGESARVTMSGDTAWRLLFNALPPERARSLVTTTGDPAVFGPLLLARSVIV